MPVETGGKQRERLKIRLKREALQMSQLPFDWLFNGIRQIISHRSQDLR